MSYIVGFVAAVPTANKDKFLEHSKVFGEIAKECGALEVVECWGDEVADGELTSFPMAVKKQDDETVIFSWIEWPDKAAQDVGMPKLMADPRLAPDTLPMPFDAQRAIFGGFEVVLKS